MNLLGYNSTDLEKDGGIHTATEISGQPQLWETIFEKIAEERDSLKQFMDKVIPRVGIVILTGAGSSAFIGLSLKGCWSSAVHPNTQLAATTDLVTHPHDFISSDLPLLLVSFARSGNSPESVAAIKLADKICKTCYHLIVTCDANGELARYKSHSPKFVFLLPEQANDQSLAMTGSYTGMLLAGLLFAKLGSFEAQRNHIDRIRRYGNRILDVYNSELKQIAAMNFNRAVFLGSGSLFGTATESHLKLQEMTDGKIICKNDSFLGFRHGPKAVIDEKTLLVCILSNNSYVHKYEFDFIQSLQKGKKALCSISLSEIPFNHHYFDLNVFLSEDDVSISEEFLPISNILLAQMLGFHKSLSLGLKPDSPSISGAISRVVEGVKIYNFQ